MSFGEIFSPVTALLRLIVTLGQKKRADRRLEGRLIARGIVAELPEDLPFHITAEDGTKEKGIYVIGLLIWNRGTLPVVEKDFLPASPLTIQLGDNAKFVGSRLLSVEEEMCCACLPVGERQLQIQFDCLNPGEYLVIPLFITGDPYADIALNGRIIGQSHPIDHTAAEVKAPLAERFASLLMLLFILNMLPGFLIGGALIIRDYGLGVFVNGMETVSRWYLTPFSLGFLALVMFLISRTAYWLERRNYPEGYPLEADMEPPLHKTLAGLCQCIFQGKKIRLSTSLFSWGKPIIMPDKKVRRRTVNDWIN